MRTAIIVVASLLAFAGLAAIAPAAAADDVPSGSCTLSYPGECTLRAGDTRLSCSGVGGVPDCRG